MPVQPPQLVPWLRSTTDQEPAGFDPIPKPINAFNLYTLTLQFTVPYHINRSIASRRAMLKALR